MFNNYICHFVVPQCTSLIGKIYVRRSVNSFGVLFSFNDPSCTVFVFARKPLVTSCMYFHGYSTTIVQALFLSSYSGI